MSKGLACPWDRLTRATRSARKCYDCYAAQGRVRRALSAPSGISSQTKSRHDTAADERFPPAVDQIPKLIEHAGLLQRNFAHEFGAYDLANIEAFHLDRLLLIGRAHGFSGDRIELFAPVVERRHVLRCHHQQDVEVLRRGVVA